MNNIPEEKIDSFNRLVYEYLVKAKLDKTAAMFKSESRLPDIKLNDMPSTLLNWYSIFLETADVRSGRVYLPDSLNRIEGIMLKLENDKQRFSRMSSLAHSYRKSPIPQRQPFPEYYDNRHFSPGSFEKDVEAMPGVPGSVKPYPQPRAPSASFLKEYKRIDLHLPAVLASKYCPINKLLILCCCDNKIYFYNFISNSVEYSFISNRRQIKMLKCHEAAEGIYMAYTSDDYSITLSRYANNKTEEIKTIDFDIPVRSYCFGNDNFAILDDNSAMRIFGLNGEILKTLKISRAVLFVEYFGKNLLMVEINRVIEFDLNMNMEIKTLCRGKHPFLFVKNDLAFVTLAESIQVFDHHSPGPILCIKNVFNVKDICMIHNRLTICTPTEILVGNDIIPLQNGVEISDFTLPGITGLLVVTKDGMVFLLTKNMVEH